MPKAKEKHTRSSRRTRIVHTFKSFSHLPHKIAFAAHIRALNSALNKRDFLKNDSERTVKEESSEEKSEEDSSDEEADEIENRPEYSSGETPFNAFDSSTWGRKDETIQSDTNDEDQWKNTKYVGRKALEYGGLAGKGLLLGTAYAATAPLYLGAMALGAQPLAN